MGFIIKALSSKFGPWLIVGLIGLLATTGTYLRWSGYNAGKAYATLECEAEKAFAYAHTLDALNTAIDEYKEQLEQQKVLNERLSVRLDEDKEIVIKEVDRVIQNTPVVINDDCKLEYDSTIGVFDNIARAGAAPSN